MKEISRQLAGYADDRPGAVADTAAGDPSLAGLRLAQAAGVAAPAYDPTTPIVPEKEGGK